MTRKRTTATGRPLDPIDARILVLHRQGRAVRAISKALAAEGTPLSKTQVADRLARLAVDGAVVRTTRGARRRAAAVPAPPPAAAAPPPSQASLDASLTELGLMRATATVPADTGDVDVDSCRRRLRWVRDAIDRYGPLAIRGELPIANISTLIRAEMDLTDRVVSQILPTPPDPERDVSSLEAAAAVRQKIATQVAAAASSARCVVCGRNPFVIENGATHL